MPEERSLDGAVMPEARARRRRRIGTLAHFLSDLLVGKTPELTVGVLVITGISLALWATHQRGALLGVILPVLVSALLGLSVRRAWVDRPPR